MVLLNRPLLWTTCVVFLLGTSSDILAQAANAGSPASPQSQQSNPAPSTSASANEAGTSNTQGSTPAASELPDSPDTSRANAQDSTQPAQENSSQQSSASGAAQNQKLQRPVGTAAAEAPKVNGVTAAQPAGVAIAPAKQHRVRTILIRTGAILGAGAALGAVIALTAATPSKPPGAH